LLSGLLLFFLFPSEARADCGFPIGQGIEVDGKTADGETFHEGEIVVNKDYGLLQYCLDGQWYRLTDAKCPAGDGCDPCTGDPTPGRICADGSIYAGTTVGGAKMYVTRCDAGMGWDEVLGACTGTQDFMRWDNPGCYLCGDGATTDIDSFDDGMANVAAMRAGIEGPQASPKGLRHGFGVQAVSSGVPLNMVQKWLGHAQLSTTAIYADAVGAEEKSIMDRMWVQL
jgi:hypothetical protein